MTGLQNIDRNYYYFNKDGVMQTGWIKAGGRTYFFTPEGYALTGWKRFGNDWLYFDKDGVMLTSAKVTIGSREYVFDGKGACVNI